MSRRGYDAVGIDRDASAVAVGCAAYGIDPSKIEIGDVGRLLSRKERRYDVVSCFSVLHHYLLGKSSMAAEEFIRIVDAATGSILFLDTGEDHEGWFAHSLAGWNAARITEWLKDKTSFTHVEILGTDRDGVGKYEGQYGRHLFACWRS
jgi:2-polyprenyl-3-methyl-5-hydroxy-6-metoxy-1,4-benzoquinol methylase